MLRLKRFNASPIEIGVVVQNLILVLPWKVVPIKFKIVFNGEMKVESVIRIPKQLLKPSHYHIFIHCEKYIGRNIEGNSYGAHYLE